MKRLAVFIMLLLHINYFMFLPQTVETDTYDANGKQTDDINSVIEYARVELGYDKTADDEDDDSGKNFTATRTCEYFFQQQITILEPTEFTLIGKNDFAEYKGRNQFRSATILFLLLQKAEHPPFFNMICSLP